MMKTLVPLCVFIIVSGLIGISAAETTEQMCSLHDLGVGHSSHLQFKRTRILRDDKGTSTTRSNGIIDPSDYKKAYDFLYDEHGYHSDTDLTHELPAIEKLVAFSKKSSLPIKSVLVLGCSHGKGASILSQHGFNTYGVDVAEKAVTMAKQLRGLTCSTEPIEPRFRQSSLTKLRYPSSFVDAGLSVDVLEHVAPADVPIVVSEISRVVKRYLFVQIANFAEASKSGEKVGMRNVHLTVEGVAWWAAQFAKGGWHVVEDTSTGTYVNLAFSKG